ncbi:hypothetical protein IHE45_05G149500 [Dioscorea alata]|uniref:Uncharacterized protein n=1 Tax=Dioscorea alata TaxID=55571 RepID=A0ACB7W656_DIOAL|nr:hypothetical protein IHE45_05G149500 [Dioscorea alata]
MGKVCCTETEDEGPNIIGLLVALIIALMLMLLCYRPRRRGVCVVHHH